jgi:hypothetical protein
LKVSNFYFSGGSMIFHLIGGNILIEGTNPKTKKEFVITEEYDKYYIHNHDGSFENFFKINEKGELYFKGDNSMSVSGMNSISKYEKYKRVNIAEMIDFGYIHHSHGLFVSKKGNVYSTGNNSLALSSSEPSMIDTVPNQIIELKNIIKIRSDKLYLVYSTYMHVLALNENGELLSWGSNSKNCLGYKCNYTYKPIKIDFFYSQKVKDFDCGKNFNIVLVEESNFIPKRFFNNSFLSDVTLESQGETIYIHQVILLF